MVLQLLYSQWLQTHSGVLCQPDLLNLGLDKTSWNSGLYSREVPPALLKTLQFARCSHSPPFWALEPACLQACPGPVESPHVSHFPCHLSQCLSRQPSHPSPSLTNTYPVSHLQLEGEREGVVYGNTEDSGYWRICHGPAVPSLPSPAPGSGLPFPLF